MGIYRRADSKFWWMLVEPTGQRSSTKIPIDGGSPAQNRELKRQALELYTKTAAKAALAAAQKPTITFRSYARWYDTHVSTHLRSGLRESSRLRALCLAFGDRDLTQIDDASVREWMTTRATAVKPSSVNRELDALKAVLRTAMPKYLDVFPLGNVRRFRQPETEPRVLTEDEEARLLAVSTPIDRAFLMLALDTLLRLSNVVNLEWAQVKFDARSILPLNAKVSTDAKPISTRLLAALQALPRADRHVFPAFHAGPPTTCRLQAIRRFEALCKLASVPHGRSVNGVTFHCLRHTGATRALQRGASLRTVMKLGGWKNAQTVLRYLHVPDVDLVAAAELIGQSR